MRALIACEQAIWRIDGSRALWQSAGSNAGDHCARMARLGGLARPAGRSRDHASDRSDDDAINGRSCVAPTIVSAASEPTSRLHPDCAGRIADSSEYSERRPSKPGGGEIERYRMDGARGESQCP